MVLQVFYGGISKCVVFNHNRSKVMIENSGHLIVTCLWKSLTQKIINLSPSSGNLYIEVQECTDGETAVED